ncbi:MAG: hypothetical protein DWQ01_11140 [Planctomycetota bacterium]|nr:MAG: hypothetical protein DWQ01_11140 [Planctomycetota bacterium]
MRITTFLLAGVALPAGLLAASQPRPTFDGPPPVLQEPEAAKEAKAETPSWKGVFAPAKAKAVRLDLEAYSGPLRIVDVAQHGSFVNSGSVLMRFDPEVLLEQIADAEAALRSAKISHHATVERARMAEEKAKLGLDRARKALEQAERNLKGWQKYELDFAKRSAEMSAQGMAFNIDDQIDELKQLEAMYRDDELTDATEEIVLNRARRSLTASKMRQELQKDRQEYTEAFSWAVTSEQRRDAVLQQKVAFDHARRNAEIERASREDGLRRSETELKKKQKRLARLERDLERLTVKSPASGLLLHGAPEKYRPGQVAPRYRDQGMAQNRSVLFTLADPDRMTVAFDVPESQLNQVREGMAMIVTPVVNAEKSVIGNLEIERFPSARSGGGAEGSFEATVRLRQGLAGVVVGMRATVKPEAKPGSER